MQYILGVDGGGTKTSVSIADLRGNVFLEKILGTTNFKSSGLSKSIDNFEKGILEIALELSSRDKESPLFISSFFGLAGLNTKYDREIFEKIIFAEKVKPFLNQNKAVLCNDTIIGLAAGSMKKNRIIIICGTGSNCYGINEYGQEAKANGWDYILGDEGAGIEMGIKTLRAVMRAYDGRGPKTILTEYVFDYLKISGINGLNRWAYDQPFTKDRFASLSLALCNASEKGDKAAIEILKQAAGEIVISISAVADKLALKDKDFDLVFVGNNFKCKEHFKDVITAELKEKYIKINFIPLTSRPVEGAIKLALQNV